MQSPEAARHSRLIILGSGPAGCTAAVYGARANLEPLLITGHNAGGQLMTTNEVENWPGDATGVMGPDLMARLQLHAEGAGAQLVFDQIESVDLGRRPFVLQGEMETYSCDALIIATGANARYLGLPSEAQYLGQGVSGCATCDGPPYKGKDVVVVGGGNTAVEEALFMSTIARTVTVVHRRDAFRAEPVLVQRLLDKVEPQGNVRILWNCTLEEVLGDGQRVNGARVRDASGQSRTIETAAVFVAIGHDPNTGLFADQLERKDGYLVTKGVLGHGATATSVPGVFAAGDVADPIFRQAITSAGSGCMAALEAQAYLQAAG